MPARPWMKWYPADWRADPKLRACAPISRYVWLEMLGLMHEAEPYGHLTVGGRAIDTTTLAQLVGVDLKTTKTAVQELRDRGVYSVTDDGVIFSRRMIRDEERRTCNRENGDKGGNPSLRNQGVKMGSVNPPLNGEVKAQIPETRIQSPDSEESPTPTPSPSEATVLPENGVVVSLNGHKPRKTYAFEGDVIKLNKSDFEAWRESFFSIPDLTAELTALDSWFVGLDDKHGANWFYRTSAMLNTRHQKWRAEEKRIGDINESW